MTKTYKLFHNSEIFKIKDEENGFTVYTNTVIFDAKDRADALKKACDIMRQSGIENGATLFSKAKSGGWQTVEFSL